MKVDFSYYISILDNCIKNGCVIYGAGRRGKNAINACRRFSISVNQIADRDIGKTIDVFEAVSVNKLLFDKSAQVCILTPANGVTEIRSVLNEHFLVVEYDFIKWLLYFFPEDLDLKRNCVPFCHYESPYPTESELYCKIDRGKENNNIKDVDLNQDGQVALFERFIQYADDYRSFLEKTTRFDKDNGMFTGLDAYSLYGMLNIFHSKRIIEIGSGFSTRLMLDYCDNIPESLLHIDSIEPDPVRIKEHIRKGDNIELIEKPVQEIDLSFFSSLQKNDILFIDSSHVAKRNGDVPYEYFKIIPRLQKGVIIHIHDIHWPFEYCDKWLEEGRAYNEIYLLHAFLMNNKSYEVLLFNSMIESLYSEKFKMLSSITGKDNEPNGSFWMRKNV